MDARDLALIPLAAALVVTFDLIAFAGLLRASAAVALAVGVCALDELLLDPRLVLAVIVGDIKPAWESTSQLGSRRWRWAPEI